MITFPLWTLQRGVVRPSDLLIQAPWINNRRRMQKTIKRLFRSNEQYKKLLTSRCRTTLDEVENVIGAAYVDIDRSTRGGNDPRNSWSLLLCWGDTLGGSGVLYWDALLHGGALLHRGGLLNGSGFSQKRNGCYQGTLCRNLTRRWWLIPSDHHFWSTLNWERICHYKRNKANKKWYLMDKI